MTDGASRSEYPSVPYSALKGIFESQPIFETPENAERLRKMLSQGEAEVELRGWWFDMAEKEIDRTVPKAVEYSATDLADIGHVLARCMGRTVDDEEAAELGVFFYMQGKMSRWAGAVMSGTRPSDDTLFDIGVYVRMTQRIRHTGGWPGTPKEQSSPSSRKESQ